MSRGAGWAQLTAGLVLMLAMAPARAEDRPPPEPRKLPIRAASVVVDGQVVRISVGYRDVSDALIRKRLTSGLPTVVVMRGYVLREAAGDPVALVAKTCRVVYDLWDEVFRIELAETGAPTTNTVAVNVEGVLRNCMELRRVVLMDRALMQDQARYFMAALVEVNPVSAEMLDRIQRWVARPSGSTRLGPGDALFGSFVGLFVARIGDADRQLAFRTEAFLPPMPPRAPE
jgi:hypothetical protein